MKTKLAGMGGAPAQTYVDDVFSTYLYTGNGTTQTITNGIDLAGKGGMVWIKNRSLGTTAEGNRLVDSLNSGRTFSWTNISESTNGRFDGTVNPFLSNGFTLDSTYGTQGYLTTGSNYASWTFRKAAKFFDVVTYTGNGAGVTKIIPHSLGVSPGMILVKKTSAAQDWYVWHKNTTQPHNKYLVLNTTAAEQNYDNMWGPNGYVPTSTEFNVSGYANDSGATYVAYLFAHDTSSTGIIQCGAVTLDGTATYQNVNLGWEAQFVLTKNTTTAANWFINDNMRGMPVDSNSNLLFPNTTGVEASSNVTRPTSTGFSINNLLGGTYIYMAIRRPNKPPTTGTQVFSPVYTSSASNPLTVTTNFPVDASIYTASSISGQVMKLSDRLRGSSYAGTTKYLEVSSTSAEITKSSPAFLGFDSNVSLIDSSFMAGGSNPKIYWNFKRAPGFFDVVCYTGTGVARTVAHNLGVAPEMMIVKRRDSLGGWLVYNIIGTATKYLTLGSQSGFTTSSVIWNNTEPTISVFSVGTNASVNASGGTYVAYLFATLAGISKVGSYTGNGTGQAIACGFSAGARFVLIKRTDSNGDWYTFDSARGLTSTSSPYSLLNSTAAETTGNNGVYASTGGFTLGSTASTTTNISGASYIFLSVA